MERHVTFLRRMWWRIQCAFSWYPTFRDRLRYGRNGLWAGSVHSPSFALNWLGLELVNRVGEHELPRQFELTPHNITKYLAGDCKCAGHPFHDSRESWRRVSRAMKGQSPGYEMTCTSGDHRGYQIRLIFDSIERDSILVTLHRGEPIEIPPEVREILRARHSPVPELPN